MSNKRARCDSINFRIQLQEGSGRIELELNRSTPLTAPRLPPHPGAHIRLRSTRARNLCAGAAGAMMMSAEEVRQCADGILSTDQERVGQCLCSVETVLSSIGIGPHAGSPRP
jgi:hypothetical protein